MKFTIKTTLESVCFAGAKLRDEDLGGLAIECKTETGRSMRDLAPFFGKQGAVRITFEADEPAATGIVSDSAAPRTADDSPHGTLAPHPANVLASNAARDERMCTCPATSEYDTICPSHGVLGIGVTGQATAPAPPVANGRPSCCTRAFVCLFPLVFGDGTGWFTRSGDTCCVFCPFCGAKLPEVPR